MQLPETARMHGDECRGDRLRGLEVVAVRDLHRSALGLACIGHGAEGEGEGIRRRPERALHRRLVGGERPRQLALEDVELVQRDLGEGLRGYPEILGQDVGRRMRHPIGDQKGVVLALLAIIEGEQKGADWL